MRRGVLAAGLILIGLVAGCGAAPPAPPPAPPPEAAHILGARQVQGRTGDLTVSSPALGKAVNVRLLLPVRYDAEPARRWPLLFLLHGCCDDYLSWTRSTDIEALSRDADVLVVMPEGGSAGFYSDWLDGPKWETFHTGELPALLATSYRAGDRQAVAVSRWAGSAPSATRPATRAGSPRPPPSAASSTRGCHPRSSRTTAASCGRRPAPTRTRCGAIPSATPRTGPATTPTTSRPTSAAPACSSRRATAGRARSTRRAPRPTASKSPSARELHRAWPLLTADLAP